MALNKTATTRLLSLTAAFALVLSLPISNFFIQRQVVAPESDPEFQAVSNLLIKKCADCHTRDMAQYPLYFGFPLAQNIMHKNIERGQSSFLMNKDKLSGKVKFSAPDVQKLSQAMAKNNMPPFQYLLLHWDSALNEKEQKMLVAWIQKRLLEYDIRPIPKENFFKPDARKAALGEKLFNDKRLSADNSVSCASCHSLDKGGTDQKKFSTGVHGTAGTLNTPSVLNAAYNVAQFWDGHARDLKAQVSVAISDPQELASNWGQAIAKLETDAKFTSEFKAVYKDGFSADSISEAIAEYEHTLLTPDSRFDKYLAGDQTALSEEEKEGFELFKSHDCATCHAGPGLGGISYATLGMVKDYFNQRGNISPADYGRFNVTHNQLHKFRFKIPILRNVALTHPYLHDGSAATLEDAVSVMSEYQVDKHLTKDEIKKVATFLRSLTGTLNGKSLELENKVR